MNVRGIKDRDFKTLAKWVPDWHELKNLGPHGIAVEQNGKLLLALWYIPTAATWFLIEGLVKQPALDQQTTNRALDLAVAKAFELGKRDGFKSWLGLSGRPKLVKKFKERYGAQEANNNVTVVVSKL